MTWNFNELDSANLTSQYGSEVALFLLKMKEEIDPFKELVAGPV